MTKQNIIKEDISDNDVVELLIDELYNEYEASGSLPRGNGLIRFIRNTLELHNIDGIDPMSLFDIIQKEASLIEKLPHREPSPETTDADYETYARGEGKLIESKGNKTMKKPVKKPAKKPVKKSTKKPVKKAKKCNESVQTFLGHIIAGEFDKADEILKEELRSRILTKALPLVEKTEIEKLSSMEFLNEENEEIDPMADAENSITPPEGDEAVEDDAVADVSVGGEEVESKVKLDSTGIHIELDMDKLLQMIDDEAKKTSEAAEEVEAEEDTTEEDGEDTETEDTEEVDEDEEDKEKKDKEDDDSASPIDWIDGPGTK